MSASAPVSTPPPVPPATTSAVRRGSPLAGFFVDLGIAVVAMMMLSVVAGIVWGLYRAAVVGTHAARSGAGMPDASTLNQQLGQPGALAQVVMAIVSTGGAALLVYFWRRRATPAERQASDHAALKGSMWGWTLLVAAGVVVASNGLGFLAKQLGIEPVPTNQQLMQNAIAQFPAFLVLFAVLLAPAYEELLFRRVLFGRLWQNGKPWLGMLLSSVAFALVHEIPGLSANSLPAMLLLWLIYGGMGAAFCWLYQRTGTLWASIAAHALNNAVALAALVFLGMQ
ncbi:MAG: hypothetical protein GAK31_03392 [Stenotrophomonas maltophilia]|uniref:CAAX prenyl protease 2/Lysostaphin resistance protein A-like domain-containing protein n=1 Tax=Stenotrophomonas maltophilia TaxID=40324 RepID=A0A7V8FDJ3_STEMA|nr:MAG: hypothetical protein GAK31_03392 [Stenotrophomonas maltophilia]